MQPLIQSIRITYDLSDSEYTDEIRLYNIPKNILDTTLKAVYDIDGCLKSLTINKEKKRNSVYSL